MSQEEMTLARILRQYPGCWRRAGAIGRQAGAARGLIRLTPAEALENSRVSNLMCQMTGKLTYTTFELWGGYAVPINDLLSFIRNVSTCVRPLRCVLLARLDRPADVEY